jgi:hypothetical protein
MDNSTRTGKIVHAGDAYFRCHELKENGKLDMEKTMSSLNKTRILENDEQKKTHPNSKEAFELGFVDSLEGGVSLRLFGFMRGKSFCM